MGRTEPASEQSAPHYAGGARALRKAGVGRHAPKPDRLVLPQLPDENEAMRGAKRAMLIDIVKEHEIFLIFFVVLCKSLNTP